MAYRVLIIILVVLGFGANALAGIKNLGIIGKTYTIAEPDALEEIHSKAGAIDWQKTIQSPETIEKLKNFKPEGIPKLPRATHDRTFLVDLTYTLDFDIPNGKGGILYPAGYTYNPLDYVEYPRTLVVFDAADPDQMNWVESSGYAREHDTRLLITDGTYYEASSRLGRHVYSAMPVIIERLKLKAVPSIIRQRGNKMEVSEIGIAPVEK